MITTPVSRKSNIVVQELENEVLIYDLNINKALCLNQTAALVYQLCDGTNTISEISLLMNKKLKANVGEELIWLALNELKKNNLLENSKEISNPLPGISRREVAKKIGLASLVALPMIASVVAPSAVMAQSGRLLAFNSACTSNGQCASGNCTTGSMLCCAPGVNPFSNSTPVCGFCPTIDFCCSGMIIDQGAAPCGGAGNFCFCQLS